MVRRTYVCRFGQLTGWLLILIDVVQHLAD
jgi:hypothetical protein